MRYSPLSGIAFSLTLVCTGRAAAAEAPLDLTRSVVVVPHGLSTPEKKALGMLADEVCKRTRIRWRITEQWPNDNMPVIAVGQESALRTLSPLASRFLRHADGQARAEGYQIQVSQGAAPVVWVAGNDARGVLFGIGHLLRRMNMEKGKITLPAHVTVVTAPQYPVRGHQLGYRPKTNSYDAWDLAQWEQYIRDLAVFGTNTVELIPPRSDDDDDSPHFPLPKLETMIGMSRICADYGLNVWIWYPAEDDDYRDPKTVDFALKEWGEVFKKLPRVDAIFVPGGDPGDTRPRDMMALLEKQTDVLHRYHPRATMWMSSQGFTRPWMDEFLALMAAQPSWLTGIVYGPHTRMSLAQTRAAIPKQYPICHYPDITHSRTCQFPVHDWDSAFALTEEREVINPRPLAQARNFRMVQQHTIGFGSYSEGCNDDVNKIVWSALGWNADADVVEALRDYSRYFIGPRYADGFAQGLLALERNWEGPALTNAGIYSTLQQFQAMEKSASPRDLLNWRFQQGLYRAYYDAYVRSRLIRETQLEDEAMARLRQAPRTGALHAVAQAEKMLAKAVTEPTSPDWRARVFEIGEALYQSIRMQLSVARYQGMEGRGTNLDTIDHPLNNRDWLLERFTEIRRSATEPERLKRIDDIVNWTNPGPGGYYDDLGNLTCQPHLVRGKGSTADPTVPPSVFTHFETPPLGRKSWWDQTVALYDTFLPMRYTGLDPTAQYKLRALYGRGPIRLVANGKFVIHPLLDKPYERVEFDIPPAATAGGILDLRWYNKGGLGGNGRSCQVAEVWLIRR